MVGLLALLVLSGGSITSPVAEPVTIPSPRVLILRWGANALEFSRTQQGFLDELRELPFDNHLAEHEAATASKIAGTMTPDQKRRWHEVSLQYAGLAALSVPAVAREIGVGTELSSKIAARSSQCWSKINARIANLRLPPDAGPSTNVDQGRGIRRTRRYMTECVRAQALEELDDELVALLNPQQKSRWLNMTGPDEPAARMREILRDPPSYPDYRLLAEYSVRSELNIDDATSDRIKGTLRRASMVRNDYMNPDTVIRQLQRGRSLSARLLSAKQIARLKQITIQTFGLIGTRNPEIAAAVGFSASDVKHLERFLCRIYREERIQAYITWREGGTVIKAPQSPTSMDPAALLQAHDEAVAAQEANRRRREHLEQALENSLAPIQRSLWHRAQGQKHRGLNELRTQYQLF